MSRPMQPACHTDHSTGLGHGPPAGLGYGLLGLPLAFVALPLYVHLPHVYASRYGLPLATLGGVLLLARLFDAVTDPWLGRLGDRLYARSPRHVLVAGGIAAVLLVLGMALLFFPPWARPGDPLALLAMLMLTCLAFSLLAITHQSWGARLGGDEVQRARIVAWREGAGLVGVVLASVLPSWLGGGEWVAVFAVALALGCWAWSRSMPPPAQSIPARPLREDLLHPWRHPPFRRLIGVFVLSGMASAVPATLVLFFIQDRLLAPAQEPLFLASYFVAAAASMPLWMRGVVRWGLARSWLAGMLLSVAVFVWAASLSSGEVIGFWWVCVLSGLALAAGLALPLLELLGYRPGATSPEGLQALTLAYAALPCTLKLLAAVGLYLAFVRPPPRTPPTLAEAP